MKKVCGWCGSENLYFYEGWDETAGGDRFKYYWAYCKEPNCDWDTDELELDERFEWIEKYIYSQFTTKDDNDDES